MQKRLFLLVLVLALMVPFAVMAQDEMVEEIVLPEVDVLDLTGDIITAGSSTVFPLTERMAERFIEAGFPGSITVDSIGSGAGLQRFCQTGETDIANSSRAIRQSEIDFCAQLNPPRTPIEFRVSTDALAVAVNVSNDFVDCLTVEQVGLIFTGQLTRWNEIDSSYPNQPIGLFSPGTDSGTYDYFLEIAIEKALNLSRADANQAILSVPGTQFSEDDNVLVQGVEGSPFGIGYFATPTTLKIRIASRRWSWTVVMVASPRTRRTSIAAPTRLPARCSSTATLAS